MNPEDIIGNISDNLEILLSLGKLEITPQMIDDMLELGLPQTFIDLKRIIKNNSELESILIDSLLKNGDKYARECQKID